MNKTTSLWVKAAVLNLCIVAVLGTVMRYKIGFEFPHFNQKFLQEAHSHFAFGGWITHSLFFLIVQLFRTNLPRIRENLYRNLIWINLFFAYGMLISFSCQGYGPVSLVLSGGSILVGYVFSFFAIKDTLRLPANHVSKNWLLAAILFSILSTIGTMVLSYMMATHHFNQTRYLGSIYFFLHFQYNGWFLFGCMAIFMNSIGQVLTDTKYAGYAFWLFFIAGIPAYFLSTLWVHLPVWLYSFVVIAAMLQIVGWWYFIQLMRKHAKSITSIFPKTTLFLFLIVALALTLKLLLQMGSTVPVISKLAFGFRPIVIAYLHLVLLLIVSVFLLSFMFGTNLLSQNRTSGNGLMIFVAGAILNEVVLAVQGIAAFSYTVIPYADMILFGIALVMLFGVFLLFVSGSKTTLD